MTIGLHWWTCSFIVSCISLSHALSNHPRRRRVIVDQDTTGPGTTNCVSIAALLCDETLQIEGITVASGDGWVGEEVLHVLRLLELMNRSDVPVYVGSAGPLLPLHRKEVKLRTTLQGHASWLGAWEGELADPYHVNESNFPEGMPKWVAPQKQAASQFIAETLRDNPGEISILALAPFTNIASAMVIEPRLPQLARELIVMGGAVACGKTSSNAVCDAGQPWHEFNWWFDPHAVRKVLRMVPYVTGNWSRIIIIPADVAAQVSWTPRLQASVNEIKTESAPASYIAKYVFGTVDATFPLFDEFAVVFWAKCLGSFSASGADNRLCKRADDSIADVDVSIDDATRGMLLTWPPGTGPHLGEQSAVMLQGIADQLAFEDDFLAMLRKWKPKTDNVIVM